MKTQTNQLSLFDTQHVSAGLTAQMPIAEQSNALAKPIDYDRLKLIIDNHVTLAEHENGGRIIFLS